MLTVPQRYGRYTNGRTDRQTDGRLNDSNTALCTTSIVPRSFSEPALAHVHRAEYVTLIIFLLTRCGRESGQYLYHFAKPLHG